MTTEQIRAWRDAAVANNWTVKPTYEPDKAVTLTRDGFVAIATMFGNNGDSLTVWGPDNLQIVVPVEYSWDCIQENLKRCLECKRISDAVDRAGFAGRYCNECLPEQRRVREFAGWAN